MKPRKRNGGRGLTGEETKKYGHAERLSWKHVWRWSIGENETDGNRAPLDYSNRFPKGPCFTSEYID